MSALVNLFLRLIFFPLSFPRNVLRMFLIKKHPRVRSDFVKEMAKNGYYVFPDPISNELLNEVLEDFDVLVENSLRLEADGQQTGRIASVGTPLSEVTKKIEDFCHQRARDYFRCVEPVHELSYYQHSRVQSELANVPGGRFHIDDNKPNIKFFIYLTDTDDANGPFEYSVASHGIPNFRRAIHWALHQIAPLRYLHYTGGGMLVNTDELERNVARIKGNAGTIFCADTTGYHRASAVKEGVRKVFVASYRLPKWSLVE